MEPFVNESDSRSGLGLRSGGDGLMLAVPSVEVWVGRVGGDSSTTAVEEVGGGLTVGRRGVRRYRRGRCHQGRRVGREEDEKEEMSHTRRRTQSHIPG
jgi:hypothetical protein